MISRRFSSSFLCIGCGIALLADPGATSGELKLPAIISDHMVLQQKQANPIWGWDTPGTTVTVTFPGQVKTAVASAGTGR